MSSVNFKKLKGAGDVSAMARHSEKEERLRHNHSNQDINKELTNNNSSMFNLSYKDIIQKYKDRIEALDNTSNTNHRKDRVTCFSLEYSVPESLPPNQYSEWFSATEKYLSDKFGMDNIIESERHVDEQHLYRDHGNIIMSRAHIHMLVVPEIDGKLDGKHFSSKKNMMAINKGLDDLTRERYGIGFMTGREAKHKSVEELKHESSIEELQTKLAELQAERDTLNTNLQISKEQYLKAQSEYKHKVSVIMDSIKEIDLNKEQLEHMANKLIVFPWERQQLIQLAQGGSLTKTAVKSSKQNSEALKRTKSELTEAHEELLQKDRELSQYTGINARIRQAEIEQKDRTIETLRHKIRQYEQELGIKPVDHERIRIK